AGAGGLWRAEIDPGQLEAALVNLAVNARDAMPEGGRLTIETSNAMLDDNYADANNDVKPGQYVMISVTDTGTGMTRETLERAFEPFFTTKGSGRGSGLGLSMVFGFVKQSGGHAKIYSEPGEGTSVKIYLPRSHAAGETAYAPAGAAPESAGTGHILVVEDDELVRQNVLHQLADLGYHVTGAENGVMALLILKADESIDLLFTDVVMPGGMNGRQLAEAATEMRPGLKVLFTSGYTENAIVHQGRLDRGVQLLSKPYRREELAAKIRKVMDTDPA
ncbi:MAG: ATP-binding protein, partial [Pseudomonadota bacterium]